MRKVKSRRGRPPGGVRPGERVIDYPQLSLRVPRRTLRKLQAVSRVTGEAQWRILSDAIERHIDELAPDRRELLHTLVKRANPVFSQPSKRVRAIEAITVLNVDDHEPMLFARSAMMRAEGWNVIEAQTGRSALDLARRHRPDIVVLDVHLPDINGIEVCRRIKRDPAIGNIKVVQLSATAKTPLDQLHGMEEGGADIYLTEPLARGTLLSVIERLVRPAPHRATAGG